MNYEERYLAVIDPKRRRWLKIMGLAFVALTLAKVALLVFTMLVLQEVLFLGPVSDGDDTYSNFIEASVVKEEWLLLVQMALIPTGYFLLILIVGETAFSFLSSLKDGLYLHIDGRWSFYEYKTFSESHSRRFDQSEIAELRDHVFRYPWYVRWLHRIDDWERKRKNLPEPEIAAWDVIDYKGMRLGTINVDQEEALRVFTLQLDKKGRLIPRHPRDTARVLFLQFAILTPTEASAVVAGRYLYNSLE